MDSQVHGPRTTADSRAEGRLKLDVVGSPKSRTNRKKQLLKRIVKKNS